jgi:hypothetical protein
MKFSSTVLAPAVLLLVLTALPTAAAASTQSGTATSCSQLTSCNFVLNGTAGTGYASTGFGYASFRLPGETNTSHGTYASQLLNVSGSVDHLQGSIFAIDANSGKIVLGSTNTYVAVTAHCGHNGCGYTYKLVNGTIAFRITNFDGTSTTVSCSPASFSAGTSTQCIAKVSDPANISLVPTGNVTFSTNSEAGTIGTFAHHGICALISGSCTIRFAAADETVGSFEIFGIFHGFHSFHKSQGSAYISVTGN